MNGKANNHFHYGTYELDGPIDGGTNKNKNKQFYLIKSKTKETNREQHFSTQNTICLFVNVIWYCLSAFLFVCFLHMEISNTN